MVHDAVNEKPNRGRPRMDPDTARRHHQSFRIRDAQRALLQSAADVNGRSLSEEVEARIERTFADDAMLARLDRIEAMLARLLPPDHHEIPVDILGRVCMSSAVRGVPIDSGRTVNPPGHAANTLDGARGLSIHHVNRRVA